MRLLVNQQRRIIQYHSLNPKFSNRKIAKMLNISHTTVAKVLELFHNSGCSYEELSESTDFLFQQKLGSYPKNPTQLRKVEPDWQYINDELKKRDMTLVLLWQEYKLDCPDGVSYSQFAKKYKKWKKTIRLSMRQNYKVGEQVLVDFCGRTMSIHNPQTGEARKVQVFVGVLGASGYIFAYAVNSQKINDWLRCHIAMFKYFDGVPEQVVTDNLKSAVITNTKTKLEINRSYAELAEHYNFAINPTRPRKPRDKGVAETSVQIVQRGILAKLRHRKFFSLEELNEAIAYELMELNDKTTRRFTTSRYEQFLKFDKPYLTAKPRQPFTIKNWLYSMRVDEFYQIKVDDIRYSVPYQYAHKRVDIAITDKLIEVYYQRQKIATHVKSDHTQPNVIDVNHMPSEHKHQLDISPEVLKSWAKGLGDNVLLWLEEFLSKKHDYALNVRKARDLRNWIRDNGFENRIDDACSFAISTKMYSLTNIQNIVKSQSYLRFESRTGNQELNHENIRGSNYYLNILPETLQMTKEEIEDA